MTNDDKQWLHIRLEIILEQAQAIRAMAANYPQRRVDSLKSDFSNPQRILFHIAEDLRDVVAQSCHKAKLTTKKEG